MQAGCGQVVCLQAFLAGFDGMSSESYSVTVTTNVPSTAPRL
jgi:hypothetical protein